MTHTNTKEADVMDAHEKANRIALEIINILKQSSQEKKRLTVDLLASSMLAENSIRDILSGNGRPDHHIQQEPDLLKRMITNIIGKLADLTPPTNIEIIDAIKDNINKKDYIDDSAEWINEPIKAIRDYQTSLTDKNKELEDFIQLTTQYLEDTEIHLAKEQSSQKQRFQDDRQFEKDLSSNVNMIKDGVDSSEDFSNFKMTVMNKIENINQGIKKKKEHDIRIAKEAEEALAEMSKRMNQIKSEADEIQKRSDEIEYDAVHDKLTGLYNRRAYDQRMKELLTTLEDDDVVASLLICDIDYFKKINDTYGHKIGDLALKKLGALLTERLRTIDFISRFGGEEFAIILYDTDLDGAVKAGDGIRAYIDKSVFSYRDEKIPLTISVGVSSFQKGDDSSTAFERADKALYLAKSSGRNQVKSENDVLHKDSANTV